MDNTGIMEGIEYHFISIADPQGSQAGPTGYVYQLDEPENLRRLQGPLIPAISDARACMLPLLWI